MRGPCVLDGCALPRAPRSNYCYAHLGERRVELAERRCAGPDGPVLCPKCQVAPRRLYTVLCRGCWLAQEREKREHERALAEKHRQQLLETPVQELRELQAYRQEWQRLVKRVQTPHVRADVRKRFQRVFDKAMQKRVDGPERSTLHDLGRNEARDYVDALS